jgi:hypothetical protein
MIGEVLVLAGIELVLPGFDQGERAVRMVFWVEHKDHPL